MDAFLGVICFNTAEAAKDKIATPTSWKDLLNPALKGKVVMPHPASSGTGYLAVAGWLQSMGEAEGWKFMDALHENIGVYTHSGSAPCVQAAKGERVAGIALDMRGASEKTKGAPLEVVIPKEGVGWEMEATADRQGHEESRTRQEDRRLGDDQGRERALFQDLCDRRSAGRDQHAAELSGECRSRHDQERSRLDGG